MELELGQVNNSNKIAAFDLDGTLVKSNRINTLYNEFVTMRLSELKDYKIVIFTNQANGDPDKITERLKNIHKLLGYIPMYAYIALKYDNDRKPCTGMWDKCVGGMKVNLGESFFVGDAYPGQFSDTDYKFALNVGIKFYRPNDYFGKKIELVPLCIPIHPINLVGTEKVKVNKYDGQELVILVGPPGSGKSTMCAKYFEDYTIVNQDVLITKNKVIKEVIKEIDAGKSVVLDRKNEYKSDRELFGNIAKNKNIHVRIVWIDMPKKLCEHICKYRDIVDNKHIPQVVINKYYSTKEGIGLEEPTSNECDELVKMGFQFDKKLIKNLDLFMMYLN
jgi:DNA 3'-phosphatase